MTDPLNTSCFDEQHFKCMYEINLVPMWVNRSHNILRFCTFAKYRMFSDTASPIVTIKTGKLKGRTAVDENGSTYLSFQGIPYAKPPLGSLRFKVNIYRKNKEQNVKIVFKAPQPAEQWDGIKDATKQGKGCYARNFLGNGFVGAEDCLFLNVYSPSVFKDFSASHICHNYIYFLVT